VDDLPSVGPLGDGPCRCRLPKVPRSRHARWSKRLYQLYPSVYSVDSMLLIMQQTLCRIQSSLPQAARLNWSSCRQGRRSFICAARIKRPRSSRFTLLDILHLPHTLFHTRFSLYADQPPPVTRPPAAHILVHHERFYVKMAVSSPTGDPLTKEVALATKSEYHVNIQCDAGAVEAMAIAKLYGKLVGKGLESEYHKPFFSDKPAPLVTFQFTGHEVEKGYAVPCGYALLADSLAVLGYELKGVPSEANGRLFVKSKSGQHGYRIVEENH